LRTVGGMRISVDPRVELMQTVLYLTGPWAETDQSQAWTPYVERLRAWFAPVAAHPAVALAADLVGQGFTNVKPNRVALHLGDPPDLPELASVARCVEEALYDWPAVSTIRDYLERLREFAVESRFMAFFAEAQPYRDEIEAHLAETVKASVVTELEAYFGARMDDYVLIGCPLYGSNGLKVPVPRPATAACIRILPHADDSGHLTWPSRAFLTHGIKHEYGHCFVNDLTYARIDDVRALAHLRARHRDNYYDWWPAVVNETIIRACSARYFALYPEDGLRERGADWERDPHEAWLVSQEQQGFRLVRGLERLLATEYEGRRDSYPSFADFYAVLLDWLRQEDRRA